MKRIIGVVAVLLSLALPALAKTVYIRNGVTDWTSGDSYYGGEAPAAGDTVVVSNKTEVTLDGSDAASCALVSQLAEIRPMYNQSRVIFDIPAGDPFVLNASVYNPEGTINGFWGEMVKRGAGEMVLASCTHQLSGNYAYDYKVGTIRVEAGTLKCPQNVPKREQQYGNIHVEAGAKLVLTKFDTTQGGEMAYYINGTLTGGGTVENPFDGNRHLRVYKKGEFSGKLLGKLELFICGEWDLTGEETATPLTPMVWSLAEPAAPGVIGVKKFGVASEVSSIGKSGEFAIDYRGGGYRYLGAGETTDKQLWISATTVHPAVMDAGPNGGITFTGSWHMNGTPAQMHEIVLRGSNTTASVLANSLSAWSKDGVAYDFQVVKEGTGTWRFNETAGQTWAGALHVREGKVQFDSFRDVGELCALGFATNCTLPYMGAADPSKRVDYAISLGSANAYPALEYMGSAAAVATTRKIQLQGCGGQLASAGGELALAGVSAAADASAVLTLDSAEGQTNYLKDIDEGEGNISIVKTGAGRWVLDGSLGFTGPITVSNGTLEVRQTDAQYTWYRFTVKRVSGGGQYFNTVEMAFYDKDGNQVVKNPTRVETESLNVWQWSDGNYRNLKPGEIGYGRAGWYKNMNYGTSDVRDLRQAFNGWAASGQPSTEIYYGGSGATAQAKGMEPTDPSSWVVFVLRLPANCPEVVAYDMMCSSDYGRQWRPSYFTLEGSRDGIYWTVLHDVAGTGADKSSGAYQWMSDGLTTPTGTGSAPAVRKDCGWPIAAKSTAPETRLTEIPKVTLAGSASLSLASGQLSGLALDADQSGDCSGAAFAETGTLTVTGTVGRGEVILGTTFTDCSALANLEGWSLVLNGRPSRRIIRIVDDKIHLMPSSMYFIIK